MKTNYIKPEIKVIAAECESMIAVSGFGQYDTEHGGVAGKGGTIDDADWDD